MATTPAQAELPDLAIQPPRELLRWLRIEGVTIEELRARDSRRVMVAARRIVARYLYRRGWSTPMIGRYLARDHTTILHHLNKETSP